MRTVKTSGKAALVEWEEDGTLQRAWVPRELAESQEEAALGIPYGVPWGEIIQLQPVDSAQLETLLRKRGIWTAADAQRHPQAIVGALIELVGVDMAAVIAAARHYEKEQ